MSEKGDNSIWNYSFNTLDLNEIWEELYWNIKSIIDYISEVIIKLSKQGDLFEKLAWNSNRPSIPIKIYARIKKYDKKQKPRC